jgi:hypothetical protein
MTRVPLSGTACRSGQKFREDEEAYDSGGSSEAASPKKGWSRTACRRSFEPSTSCTPRGCGRRQAARFFSLAGVVLGILAICRGLLKLSVASKKKPHPSARGVLLI